ncbi:MAG: MTH1187 family thiamine-binding protein [Dehalococcoidia bacterium]
MAIAEISIIPLGTKTPSVSKYVARAVKVLQQERDLKYQITSMGTIIEGRLDKILAVAEKMHEGTFGREVTRVITLIEIDDRRDQASSMKGKMNSLTTELEH